MTGPSIAFTEIEATLKRAAGALLDAGVPFAVGGSLACWARGGPEFTHDLDLFVAPEDAEPALEVLAAAGLRPEHPPERWLVKAWDDGVLVDVIHSPIGLTIDRALLARCERRPAAGLLLPLLPLEDVLATKLLAFNEHYLEYSKVLQIARAIREQVDWPHVRDRCRESPYARGFFFLATELGIIAPDATQPPS